FDRISGGFYYLAEGGQSPKARVEGDLIEMVSPALEAAGDNADLDSLLEGVIDRILLDVSKGDINEAAVELAGALPRLCTDGRGTDGCDLEAFEREAASLVSRSAPFETLARVLASRLSSSKHSDVVTVPLFGEARREKEPVITVHLGSNTSHSTQLAARDRWLVSGEPNREITLAPQRANTVRVPTASAPAGGDNGTNAGRPPARPPAAGRPAVATTPVSSSSAPVARPAPISNRLTASAPPARATLPRPAQIAPQPPASDRNPSPSQRGPASSPRAPLAAPEIVFKSESEPPASEVEHVDLESLPEPLFANPRPVHEAPSEPEKGPRAPEVASFGDEPLFRQDAPVQHENPPVEHEELASEEAIEDPPDAPEVVSPPALPVEGRIFVPAARGGRQDIEPEPMTQPSQRRRREMEEAQARAVKDARRLALWLVIGVIFILVLVYVISNVH
ncbi:MAG TPA: hypothetical protein VNO21_08070, partial [Polyangiaceae bacterium]|nr:hypothetical protein [Polyangiaceae bacterium]